jgi:hypothetical protein
VLGVLRCHPANARLRKRNVSEADALFAHAERSDGSVHDNLRNAFMNIHIEWRLPDVVQPLQWLMRCLVRRNRTRASAHA